MKIVRQEDMAGCGVACVASVLGINYKQALDLFEDGEKRAKFRGFYCREIVQALGKAGLRYKFKYADPTSKEMYTQNSIVYIKKSPRYPIGHFLTRGENCWIDSWINFPDIMIKAGIRKRLPGKVKYFILLQSQ